MQLYPHNQRAYDNAVNIFRQHNKTCVIHPTGTGKAVIIAKFILSNPGARHLLLAPGEHIAAEVAKHTEKAAFTFHTYNSPLSDQTFKTPLFDYIYLDEFHRVGAGKWGPKVLKLLAANPRAKVLGTTATHIRFLDNNRDMAFELFKGNIASYFSLNRAFLEGILMAPKYISAIYSISQEHRRIAERISQSGQLQKESLLKELRARIIDWESSSGLDSILKKHLPPSRKKLIVFCASAKEMKIAEETLIPILTGIFGTVLSLPVHVNFPKSMNDRSLARFNEEDEMTKVLFTVNMITEGLHGRDISTVILLRETNSPIIWYQQIGRCFSVGQREQPIIFDLVNNFRNIQHTRFKEDYEQEKAALLTTRAAHTNSHADKKFTAVEFIDETQGIREMLASFESRTEGWMTGYLQAKAFFDKNGYLKVTTKQDKKLLQWICMQQIARRAGRLSAEKVKLLTKIGIDWHNSDEERWQAKFLQLKTVIGKHGCLPPTYKSLYDWLTVQKRKYQQNQLKKEHQHLLQEIISLENHSIVAWNRKLKRIEEYFAKHKKFLASDGDTIQKVVEMVREAHRKGKLPQLVYDRLKQLGFKFEYQRNRYNTQEEALELFVKFIKENDGKLPTAGTNPYLRQWYSKQCTKYRYGRMEKEHIDLFRIQEAAIGVKLLPTLIITPEKQARRA